MKRTNSNPNIQEIEKNIISFDNNQNSVELGVNGNDRAKYLLKKAAVKDKKVEFERLEVVRKNILDTIEHIKRNPHIIDAPARQGFAGDELRKNALTEAFRWTIPNAKDSIEQAKEKLAKASQILEKLCSKNVEETKEYVEKVVKRCDMCFWIFLSSIVLVPLLIIAIAISQKN